MHCQPGWNILHTLTLLQLAVVGVFARPDICRTPFAFKNTCALDEVTEKPPSSASNRLPLPSICPIQSSLTALFTLPTCALEPTDKDTFEHALLLYTPAELELYYEQRRDASEELNEKLFLSFEEWKKRQNVVDIYDSARKLARIRPLNLEQGGDVKELEKRMDQHDPPSSSNSQQKSTKDRFNYASRDCAAKVLATNEGFKSASAVLNEDGDSYAINKCSASSKFLVIELCDDIKVDTITLANYEMFSSRLRHFTVSVSTKYPVPDSAWVSLGTHEAKNTREIQTFILDSPAVWVRYLRLDFQSHYGASQLCPLSLVRVLGTTMMDDYKSNQDIEQGLIRSAMGSKKKDVGGEIESNFTIQEDGRKDGDIKDHLTAVNTTVTQSSIRSEISSETYKKSQSINTTSTETTVTSTPDTIEQTSANSTTRITSSSVISTSPTQSTAYSADNVYSTINRRLSLLEANASLSLRYIEDQSKLLMEAFATVDRAHATKVDNFILALNSTFSAQLFHWKHETEHMLKVLESHESDMVGLASQLRTVMKELFVQRTIVIVHSFFLVAFLVLLMAQKLPLSPNLTNPLESVAPPKNGDESDERVRTETLSTEESHRSTILRTYSTPQLGSPRLLWTEQSPGSTFSD